jgi:restriction system protein
MERKVAELKLQNDPVPTYQLLMRPTLNALKALGGSGSNEEIYDKVVELEGYSEDLQNVMLPSGRRPKLLDKAGWARSYLKMVGALDNSGTGTWSLTTEGETISDEEITRRIKQKIKEGAELRKQKKLEEKGKIELRRQSRMELVAPTMNEENDDAENVDFSDWKEELLDVIGSIKPDAFERLCQRLLRESGFTKVQVTGKTGDGGIDGIGVLKINLLSFTVFFQCKRYKGSVGAGAIRDFRGAMMGRADKGLVITTGTFTSDARKEATRDGATAIDLVDGEDLSDLLKRHKLGIQTELVENITIESEFFGQI